MDKIEVTQWRKKPVVVEAMKYPGHTVTGVDTLLAFEDWIEPLAKAAGRWPLTYRGQSLIIPTLEGDHEAKPGDYIIRGVSGEIYPCKPDIFAKTYEPALATRTDATPVAWMYYAEDGQEATQPLKNRLVPNTMGWTETPLYTHPPATDVAALVEAARAFASKQTVAEALADPTPPAWAGLSIEGRSRVLGENKAKHDAEILALRQALAPFTKGQNDG